jgi:translation initiation factor 2 beta subunit (eIF-2beta)/eIF-5
MRVYGTKVTNPSRRYAAGYVACLHCGKYYTKLGISRHWDKCKANPKKGGVVS